MPTYDPKWQIKYASMIATAEQAVARIRPGERVFLGTGCGEPLGRAHALAQRASDLADVEILQLLTFGEAPYAHRELSRAFRVNSFFIGENIRAIVQEG